MRIVKTIATTVCLCMWGFIAVVFVVAEYNSFFGECAHAPKSVEFHQGMTLCPGQSATIDLHISEGTKP